ncbi:MAG TPA: uroporphyrinogen-III C-methyltransferase [Gemmataceae bacterium]|nr:uroporphyrinogen-III C-methyltransferase [Gemmataceae bacterium]
MSDYHEPRVFLVGAGPGHPGLLTLRALECLAKADLVIYDRLVSSRLLDFAPSSAERVCVTAIAEHHVERCPHVNDLLVKAAREGKRVVRLKGGDPLIFGRGGEEAEILRQEGIPFEIVPGVTAAVAAAACAGIPLTHRLHSSAVALITGHENPEKPEANLDWSALARFPGTLAIYMGMSRLSQIVKSLLEHGKASDTPSAVVFMASTGAQRTVTATLADLPEAVEKAGLTSPSIVLIGEVVELRQQLAWFEHRPLFGKSVLVTRPKDQAAELAQRLDELGAVVHLLPAVEIQEPEDWTPVDRAIECLATFQWLAFTSVNGVHAFLRRLRNKGKDLRALGTIKIAVIGSATADALRSYHLEPDLMPDKFRSEELAEALREKVRGQRVLLARADRGREVLPLELSKVAEVTQIAVYRQADAVIRDSEPLNCLSKGEIDYVLLTSSNIARAFAAALNDKARETIQSGHTKIVSISPVTSAAVRELGWSVAAEAREFSTKGVVQSLLELARAK